MDTRRLFQDQTHSHLLICVFSRSAGCVRKPTESHTQRNHGSTDCQRGALILQSHYSTSKLHCYTEKDDLIKRLRSTARGIISSITLLSPARCSEKNVVRNTCSQACFKRLHWHVLRGRNICCTPAPAARCTHQSGE